jgi:hypothetical protein
MAKTVEDFRARRWGWVALGATLTVLVPVAFVFMATTLAQFIQSGGL